MEVKRFTVDSGQLTDCKYLNKHSEVQEVYCTVVHLNVVCDKCGQIIKTVIET